MTMDETDRESSPSRNRKKAHIDGKSPLSEARKYKHEGDNEPNKDKKGRRPDRKQQDQTRAEKRTP